MASNNPFDNQAIAKAANSYSRDQIREGTTQLQNNFYDIYKQRALSQAIRDIRQAVVKDDFFLNIENTITHFEKRIADCKKFSIGNCHELALMALDYMVRNQPRVNAEVYSIKGGDHVFLVIGRANDSDPRKPETWGDNAYICDPWSDAVYPAKDYLEKTKNFYCTVNIDGTLTNHIEDFDPSRHEMDPIPGQNNTHIIEHSQKLNTILITVFTTINNKHCDIFDQLANDLEKTAKRLTQNYGEDDPKVKIINEKIGIIRQETAKFRTEFNDYIEKIKTDASPENYQSHKEINDQLQKHMKSQMNALRKSASLSTEEHKNLNQYRKEDSLITMIMKFLNIAPSSSREYKTAVEKTENKISEFSTRVNTTLGR